MAKATSPFFLWRIQMKKPKPKHETKSSLNYNDCIHYIEEKYGIDTRDMAGSHKAAWPNNIPYLDTWHWFLDNDFGELHNGSYQYLDINLTDWRGNPKPEHVQQVLKLISDEFGEYATGSEAERLIEFWIEW